jgi:hypothetical protein
MEQQGFDKESINRDIEKAGGATRRRAATRGCRAPSV